MNCKIVAIGEVLYDCFGEEKNLGGAPLNFAGHTAALGGSVTIISAVGDDELGRLAVAELSKRNVQTAAIVTSHLPTGTVDVVLTDGQPEYTINHPAAWDAIELNDAAKTAIAEAQALCFGTLAQREPKSRATIQAALELAPSNTLKMLDVNLRNPPVADEVITASVRLANAMKLNDEEVEHIARILNLPTDYDQFAQAVRKNFGIEILLITLGGDGANLYRRDERCHVSVAKVEKMVSTVGAGDSFTAAAIIALLQNKPLQEVGQAAVRLAAKTCSHPGGLPTNW